MTSMKCTICRVALEYNEAYEYRGKIACDVHFDQLQGLEDKERVRIFDENKMPEGTISVELYETLRKNPHIVF